MRLREDGVYEVDGNFTMHGVTKPLSVEVRPIGSGNDPWGGFRAGFHTEFVLTRSEFDMSFLLEGLSDDITIMLGIEATRG